MARSFARIVLLLFLWESATAADKLIAIRLDPGRLYSVVEARPGETEIHKVTRAATQVIDDAVTAGADHVFVIAYAPDDGAFYPTRYPGTLVERGYGKDDFLHRLLDAAKVRHIKVVASFRLNDYPLLGKQHPDWLERDAGGSPYRLLSPATKAYRDWYRGLLIDFVDRYEVDGLEAYEGYVDTAGAADSTVDYAAIHALHPEVAADSPEFKHLRSQAMTALHQVVFEVAAKHHMKSYAVQTWSAHPDGTLWPVSDMADDFGFDLQGIANVKPAPDGVAIELIYQQWASSNPARFSPQWAGTAGAQARSRLVLQPGTRFLIHIEATPASAFQPGAPPQDTASPIPWPDLATSMASALGVADGLTIYDYVQLRKGEDFLRMKPLARP